MTVVHSNAFVNYTRRKNKLGMQSAMLYLLVEAAAIVITQQYLAPR